MSRLTYRFSAFLFFLSLLFCHCFDGVAQTHIGPSLTASTSKIAYEKGTLDAELIGRIIARKKEEVKKELMQRTVLNCLECGPFATWNYARQSMEVLLDERDPKVMTKELLRHSAELAVVLGISEYYLRLLADRSYNYKLNKDEMRFLLQYFKWMDLEAKNALFERFISNDTLSSFDEEDLRKVTWDSLENTDSYYKILSYYSRLESEEVSALILDENGSSDFNKEYTKILGDSVDEKGFFGIGKKKEADLFYSKDSLQRTEEPKGKYLAEVSYLKLFNNATKNYSESKGKYNPNLTSNCQFISPNHILVDMVFEICKDNQYLKSYGFFHNIGVGERSYHHLNKYTIFNQKLGADYRAVEDEITALVNLIMGSFDIIKMIYREGDLNLNLTSINKSILNVSNAGDNTTLRDVIDKIADIQLDVDSSGIKEDWSMVLDNLITLSLAGVNKEEDNQLYYFIEKVIEPDLLKLKIASNTKDSLVDSLEETLDLYKDQIANKALERLKTKFIRYAITTNVSIAGYSSEDLLTIARKLGEPRNLTETDSVGIRLEKSLITLDSAKAVYQAVISRANSTVIDISNFIALIQTINNLDEVSTYDLIAKFLSGAGDIFGDNSAIKLFNRFVNDFDKYMLIDEEEETLDINVEDIAVDLYKNVGDNLSSRFSLYFGVGVNQGITFSNDFGTEKSGISSLYFVSEKIGLQFKFIDWKKKSALGTSRYKNKNKEVKHHIKNASVRNPIVSNWHLLAYGSGLLYQVDFLNSEESSFSSPVVGLGTGLTFFNGLDLNLSLATLSSFSSDDLFVNLGFDIKITEYLSELGKGK